MSKASSQTTQAPAMIMHSKVSGWLSSKAISQYSTPGIARENAIEVEHPPIKTERRLCNGRSVNVRNIIPFCQRTLRKWHECDDITLIGFGRTNFRPHQRFDNPNKRLDCGGDDHGSPEKVVSRQCSAVP
jgi:hypothetical protein